MIQSIFDNVEISDILSIPFEWNMEYNLEEKVKEAKRE